jgi:hypothetical protein
MEVVGIAEVKPRRRVIERIERYPDKPFESLSSVTMGFIDQSLERSKPFGTASRVFCQ